MYASKGKILKTMFLLFKYDIKVSTFDLIFSPEIYVLQTIQMKLTVLCVWAERVVLGSAQI